MGLCLRSVVLGLTAVLASATEALAWGPAVHCAVADTVLANLPVIFQGLSHAFVGVLAAHPDHFLYGCLSADIFIGKGSRMKPGHSHDWRVGLQMLRQARQSQLQAYAYGYLAHLAADTVAHNYFVPSLLNLGPSRGTVTHVYLEYLAEGRVVWRPQVAAALFAGGFRSADDVLLQTLGKSQSAQFRMKKQLFRSGLALRSGGDLPLKLLGRLRPLSAQSTAFLDEMLRLAHCAVHDVLRRPMDSPVLELDPIGEHPISQAKRNSISNSLAPGELFPVASHIRQLAPCVLKADET